MIWSTPGRLAAPQNLLITTVNTRGLTGTVTSTVSVREECPAGRDGA
jgi:hypothetical protein